MDYVSCPFSLQIYVLRYFSDLIRTDPTDFTDLVV
jgi:hypothetical protein